MASAFGDLNGSGNQQIYVAAGFAGQSGNSSIYNAEVRYYGNGWGSWDSSSTFYWYANFGGNLLGGAWNIPFGNRNDPYTVLWAGQFAIGHDGEGFGPAFNISASIDTNHTSIGDGAASANEGAPPRIPKPPSAARNVRLVRADPTAMTIAWDSPADNRGAGILDYTARIHTRSPTDSAGYSDIVVGAGARSVTFSNLKPGTPYYFLVYARNAMGYAPKSNELNGRTISGAYLRYGNAWVPVEVLVYTSSGWQSAEVLTYTATGWQQAI